MIPPISSTQPFEPISPVDAAISPLKFSIPTGESFQTVLDHAIQTVEKSHETAAQEVNAVLAGQRGELHSAILAVQRSELQFQFFLQLRNKVVNAYQEVMRVQL